MSDFTNSINIQSPISVGSTSPFSKASKNKTEEMSTIDSSINNLFMAGMQDDDAYPSFNQALDFYKRMSHANIQPLSAQDLQESSDLIEQDAPSSDIQNQECPFDNSWLEEFNLEPDPEIDLDSFIIESNAPIENSDENTINNESIENTAIEKTVDNPKLHENTNKMQEEIVPSNKPAKTALILGTTQVSSDNQNSLNIENSDEENRQVLYLTLKKEFEEFKESQLYLPQKSDISIQQKKSGKQLKQDMTSTIQEKEIFILNRKYIRFKSAFVRVLDDHSNIRKTKAAEILEAQAAYKLQEINQQQLDLIKTAIYVLQRDFDKIVNQVFEEIVLELKNNSLLIEDDDDHIKTDHKTHISDLNLNEPLTKKDTLSHTKRVTKNNNRSFDLFTEARSQHKKLEKALQEERLQRERDFAESMKILDRVKDEKFIRILRQDKRKSEELRQVIDAFYKSCQSPVVKVTKKLGNK